MGTVTRLPGQHAREARELWLEFQTLKDQLFGGCMFAESYSSPEWDRYSQLLGLFFPQFRPEGWSDPREEARQ